MNWQANPVFLRRLALSLLGYGFLLRLAYSARVELLPEETYYWNYSRHLDIGYLDHPPMVAWLIRVGTTLFGDTEFGVRFGAICCGVVVAVFVFKLTRNLFGEQSALLALLLSQVLPFFFLAGTLMTPDAPLTAAWAASLYFLERALVAGRSGAWMWAGLVLGIGLLSKYSIGLLGIATFCFMLLDGPSRRWFRRWEPYAAVGIAIAVFAPVILWNAQHDWSSFAFQTSRRLAEPPRFSLHKLLGAAIILMTPTGMLAVIAAFLRRKPPDLALAEAVTTRRSWQFIELNLFVPLAVFLFFSLWHEVKLDWTGAPWTAALPVLAFGIASSDGPRAAHTWRWLRFAWPATLVVALLVYTVGWCYLVLGLPGVGYSKHVELMPVGWRSFARQIDEVVAASRGRNGEELLVVGMDRYAIASELAFYSADHTRSVAQTSSGHLFDGMGLMYEQWFPAVSQTGRSLLLATWDRDTIAQSRLSKYFDAFEPVREGVLMQNGSPVRGYYFRVAHGYHVPALVPSPSRVPTQ